jgi:hypothetical protein
LGNLAALAAGRREHLARTSAAGTTTVAATSAAAATGGITATAAAAAATRTTLRFTRRTAIGATIGLVGEALRCEKFLLSSTKRELGVAVNARECFISIQGSKLQVYS